MSDTIDSFKGKHAFLSNFHPSPVRLQLGNKVAFLCDTAEHAFQALKTDNPDEQTWVAAAGTPGEAKKRGRKVTLVRDWENVKARVMAEVVKQKFDQNPALARQLALTGDALLIEGNSWHDQFFGSCFCSKHANTPGQNWLGRILMAYRERLSLE